MIISADIHIKKYTSYSTVDENGRNSRMMDGIAVLDKLIDLARSDDGLLVIAGDMFDERDFIATEAYHYVYNVLKTARDYGVSVYIVPGNHELLCKQSSISSLSPLCAVADVMSAVCSIHKQAVQIVFLPWQDAWDGVGEKLDRELSLSSSKQRVLIGHVPVAGASLGASNYRLREGGVTPDDLLHKSFQHVILGHYHKPQSLAGNVHYVGSPLQLNFGEMGEEKRCLKLNMSTMALESIVLDGFPKFHAGVYLDGKIELVEPADKVYGFLKVYCHGDENLVQVQKAVDAFKEKHQIRSVQIERIVEEKKHDIRLEITKETKDVDVVKGYVDYVPTALDKILLNSIGDHILDYKSAEELGKELLGDA